MGLAYRDPLSEAFRASLDGNAQSIRRRTFAERIPTFLSSIEIGASACWLSEALHLADAAVLFWTFKMKWNSTRAEENVESPFLPFHLSDSFICVLCYVVGLFFSSVIFTKQSKGPITASGFVMAHRWFALTLLENWFRQVPSPCRNAERDEIHPRKPTSGGSSL